tara:strand:- start:5358 stop:6503 length:1146 start_codon:yes stop_codon:yes gene_type:complete
MIAKIKQIICISLVLLNFKIDAQEIITGAMQTNIYLPLLKEKKIGIVSNQTSLIKNTHLVDSLLENNINIIKVFSPEHGFRGDSDAGEKIDNKTDKRTGLPIISLYGNQKRPSKKQLTDIDIIIFDIQDVGARFYTYISTLHYIMDAASENNIKVIILDRPNPNGHYIDGPIREDKFKSFVGMHPVPIVHGMTIGEYAKMINGEKWISKECELIIIKMKNYQHNIRYELPIKPSPNLPNSTSINLYPSLCLFEGTSISVGRGTKYPFQHFGSPYLKEEYSFTPESMTGSKNPKYKNIKCFGIDLRSQKKYLNKINLKWLIFAYNKSPNKESFFNSFFDKLAGTSKLRKQIISGKSDEEIIKSWQKDLEKFQKIRAKYIIYQ